MMKLTFIACAFLVLAVSHYGQTQNSPTAIERSANVVIRKIDEAISYVTGKIKELEEYAKQYLNKIRAIGQKIKDEVEQLAEGLIQKLKDRVDALAESVSDECKVVIDQFRQDIHETIDDVNDCIDETVYNGAQKIDDVVSFGSEILSNLTVYKEEAIQCTQNINGVLDYAGAVTCLNLVGIKATWAVSKRIPALTYQITVTTVSLASTPLQEGLCAGSKIFTSVTEKFEERLKQLEQCIKNPSTDNNI